MGITSETLPKIQPDSIETEGCDEREKRAAAALRVMNVGPKIMKACARVALEGLDDMHSYSFLKVCANARIAAQRSAALLPIYDIVTVCAGLMRQAGSESYFLEKSCRDNEQHSLTELRSTLIEPRILRECARIMDATDSRGYFLLLSCVRNEMEAKKEMSR